MHSSSQAAHRCCLPTDRKGSALGCMFSELNDPARQPSVYASLSSLARSQARLEARMESLLLFRRAFSSPTMCRFIPAPSVAHLQVGGVVDLLLQFAGSLLGGERLPRGAVIAKKNALCERKER